jgi:hypothetical protein
MLDVKKNKRHAIDLIGCTGKSIGPGKKKYDQIDKKNLCSS